MRTFKSRGALRRSRRNTDVHFIPPCTAGWDKSGHLNFKVKRFGNRSRWLAAQRAHQSFGGKTQKRKRSLGVKHSGPADSSTGPRRSPNQTRVHRYWPARIALLKRRAINWMMSREGKRLGLPLFFFLSLSHMLSLSFLYQVVVSISPNPLYPLNV